MVAKSYHNASFFAECFQRLDGLRDSGETCDIRLLASNKEISAHKLVLATVSEYFKNAIYGLFSHKSDRTVLELKDVKYEILSQIVDYMYSGTIEINTENVYDLYDAADYYMIDFLKDMCLNFLLEYIDIDNCVQRWLLAYARNSKHEKLGIETRKFIFSNLEKISNKKDFLSLSNEEIFELFKLCPKHELSDSIVTSLLRWANGKENWEETLMNILKDIPHSSISEDYLDNFSNNDLIQNSSFFNKWIMNIYKEKLKLYKLNQTEPKDTKSEIKVSTSLLDNHILFVTRDNMFYKYNFNDGAIKLFHKMRTDSCYYDYEFFKKWIYLVGDKCGRFSIDDPNQINYESAFQTNHDKYFRSAIVNESLYIFGGRCSPRTGSIIDLNTKKTKSFSLAKICENTGVAVHDGSIYICGGWHTESIELFDPREGRTTFFSNIPSDENGSFCSAAVLSNQLYCSGYELKMVDLRNRNLWSDIEAPQTNGYGMCLVSSNEKLYTIAGTGFYEYDNILKSWKGLGRFPELYYISKAISFQ